MTGCKAYGAEEVKEALIREVRARGLHKSVEVRETGCQGFCAKAPVLTIDPLGIFYQEVTPADAADIVVRTIQQGDVLGPPNPHLHPPPLHPSQRPPHQFRRKAGRGSVGWRFGWVDHSGDRDFAVATEI